MKSFFYCQKQIVASVLTLGLYNQLAYNPSLAQDAQSITNRGTGKATAESYQVLSFDVGKQRAGASIRAELNIVNDSGGPLSFNVTAGCNCTKVDPKFSIEKSMTGQMRFDVRMPVNPQNVDVGLVCKDESRSILLNVRLLAAVEPDVVAEPKRIRIKSSSEESHTFEIKSNFKSVVVEKA